MFNPCQLEPASQGRKSGHLASALGVTGFQPLACHWYHGIAFSCKTPGAGLVRKRGGRLSAAGCVYCLEDGKVFLLRGRDGTLGWLCHGCSHYRLAFTAPLVLTRATMWFLISVVSFHQIPIPISHLSLAPGDGASVLEVYGDDTREEPAGSGPVSFLRRLHSCFFSVVLMLPRGPHATL